MTRYSSTMTEALQEIREGFSPKQIKMAIGIASDKRYAGGNMTGAVQAIEKIKKGLSDHPQVRAVLQRQNEDLEEALPPHLAKLFDKDGNFKDPKKQKVFDRMMGDGIGKEIAQKMGRIKFRVQADSAKKKVMVYVDQNDESDAQKALKNHPAYVSGALRVIPEAVNLDEGTWALPDSPKAKAELKKLMSKPIKLGKEGDDASDAMYSLIGDDELLDDLYVAGKKNPNGDARPIIKKAMKRLGIKEEVELEEGFFSKEYEPGQYVNGDEAPFVNAIKRAGGKNIDVQKPTRRDPMLTIEFEGDVKKAQKEVSRVGDGTEEIDEKLGKNADAGDYIDDFMKSDAPQFKGKSDKKKKDMAIAAYLDAKDKKEEVELDELKEPFVVVDTADGNKVVGTASDEKGAKSIISTSQLPPMKIKDKKTLKIVKVKKKQMIGYPIKEEPEKKMDKPDSAKAVDQGREDKKKTRIAQLQLQIAKAQETINKLNSQEKPDA